MENTAVGDKAWNAHLQCNYETAMRGINLEELNRAEEGDQCHSFAELESYGNSFVEGKPKYTFMYSVI